MTVVSRPPLDRAVQQLVDAVEVAAETLPPDAPAMLATLAGRLAGADCAWRELMVAKAVLRQLVARDDTDLAAVVALGLVDAAAGIAAAREAAGLGRGRHTAGVDDDDGGEEDQECD